MTTQVPDHTKVLPELDEEFDFTSVKTPRRAVITEQPVVRNIIDVTMVGLIGGGPRLAAKAAGVMIRDAYPLKESGSRVRVRRMSKDEARSRRGRE